MTLVEITALAASFLTFMLALLAWFNRRAENINTAFAYFMLSLSMLSFINYKFGGAETVEQFKYWVGYAYVISSFVYILIFYFVLVLTGYIHRLKEKILGLPLYFYFIMNIVLVFTVNVLELFTNVLVGGYQKGEFGSYEEIWTKNMIIIEIFGLFLFYIVLTILFRAFREAETGPRRLFIRLNIIGVIMVILFSAFLTTILPMMGIIPGPFIDLSTIIAAMIFYFAINRYQLDTIRDLNIGLERKVEARTRHLRETQAKLVQSEKMASMGRLVAGVAHEINNPIGAVNSSQNTLVKAAKSIRNKLEEHFSGDDSRKTDFEKPLKVIDNVGKVIKEGGERVSEIVKKLKNFAQLDEAELQETDINEDIENSIEMYRHELKPGVVAKKNLANIPKVTCFPAKLNQLYLMMLDNANRAIQDEGEITVSTAIDDDNLTITIADTGIGVPADNLKRIFDPGFTTWGVGVGVGLGLSICYQIAQEHRGTIEVDSEEGKGTEFRIKLPLDLTQRVSRLDS